MCFTFDTVLSARMAVASKRPSMKININLKNRVNKERLFSGSHILSIQPQNQWCSSNNIRAF